MNNRRELPVRLPVVEAVCERVSPHRWRPDDSGGAIAANKRPKIETDSMYLVPQEG